MRVLIQRVTNASVLVADQEVGRIGLGLVLLLGVAIGDREEDAQYLVDKLVNLRVFPDDQGRFNLSALDKNADLLVVSQFTLYADTRRGRRPSFTEAAAPDEAQRLYQYTIEACRDTGLKVATGRFQEHMQVRLENDGPVTLLLDSADRHRSRQG
ncbi:MAG: D-tyrosyl-tRNA(Tyr) deacylase [SAR202 cluster bacterium Io17-Chloro-G9]|nr:MAG: D-tyrosyl-tRNA(Tyr) deacylase [SAR202 cluster bacterium Io17-Chloro-G9]